MKANEVKKTTEHSYMSYQTLFNVSILPDLLRTLTTAVDNAWSEGLITTLFI